MLLQCLCTSCRILPQGMKDQGYAQLDSRKLCMDIVEDTMFALTASIESLAGLP